MANCAQISAFLGQAQARQISSQLAPADLATLQQLGLVVVQSPAEHDQVAADVAQMAAKKEAIDRDEMTRVGEFGALEEDRMKTHSILFHLEGSEKRAATLAKESQDSAALAARDQALAAEIAAFNDLLAKRALSDTLTPYGGQFVAITGTGIAALRDLSSRLYRVSDLDFGTYWTQSQNVLAGLTKIADRARQYAYTLANGLPSIDRTFLWSVAIGVAKLEPMPPPDRFPQSFGLVAKLSPNLEDRLLAAEILTATPGAPAEAIPALQGLVDEARKAGVPKDAALGVAAILLAGRRADGTYATANLPAFRAITPSFESAALLSVVNRPSADVRTKFLTIRALFAQAGYGESEDLELASAFLTCSELPTDAVVGKAPILARGLGSYLQYPLVGAAILTSIPVLEANETLNLLETAYEILGSRTGPTAQAELVCLAIRMIHGISIPGVNELDPTAAARTGPVAFTYGPGLHPLFVPILVSHWGYYSTFGGVGGFHPAHVHVWAGGFAG